MSVGKGRIVKVVTADGEVLGRECTVIGIAVTKVGATDTLELRDTNGSGTIKLPAMSASGIIFIPCNLHFKTALYANVTGTTAEYVLVID